MLRQERNGAARQYQASDRELDALALRMRRLALHGGYERGSLDSPLLNRLMPRRKPVGTPAMAIAELRRCIDEAGLDRTAVVYLTGAVEDELDRARIRQT